MFQQKMGETFVIHLKNTYDMSFETSIYRMKDLIHLSKKKTLTTLQKATIAPHNFPLITVMRNTSDSIQVVDVPAIFSSPKR